MSNINYSGVFGNRKVTLPSIESWGSNMNIMKDPPKSVFTRRKDKVFDTQQYSSMIEKSTQDRYCENVKVFPSGVNPSVAVSYSNYGNNGAKLLYFGKSNLTSGGSQQNGTAWTAPGTINGNTMAKYPYQINPDNFKPPIVTQSHLQPLSRLSRSKTNVNTNVFDMKKQINRDDYNTEGYKRSIVPELYNTNVRPTNVYQMGPVQAAENKVMSDALIQKNIREQNNIETFTQKSEQRYIHNDNRHPQNHVRDNLNTAVDSIKSVNNFEKSGAENNQISVEQYIGDVYNTDITTGKNDSAAIYLADMKGNSVPTELREQLNIETFTNKKENNKAGAEQGSVYVKDREQFHNNVTAHNKADYTRSNINYDLPELQNKTPLTNIFSNQSSEQFHKEYEYNQIKPLEQNRNYTEAYTNPNTNQQDNQQNIVKDAKLLPKISPNEGFEGKATVPIEIQENYNYNLDSEQNQRSKTAANNFKERYYEQNQFNHTQYDQNNYLSTLAEQHINRFG